MIKSSGAEKMITFFFKMTKTGPSKKIKEGHVFSRGLKNSDPEGFAECRCYLHLSSIWQFD